MPESRDTRWYKVLLACLALLIGTAASASPSQGGSATIVRVDVSRTMQTGGTYAATIEVRNSGNDAWTAGRRTRISYRWLRQNGVIVVDEAAGTPLVDAVSPGSTASVAASVIAPPHLGTMFLQWQVLQDGPEGTVCLGRQEQDVQTIEIEGPPGLMTPWRRLAAILAATSLHFFLVSFWLFRYRRQLQLTSDQFAFHSVAIGLGSLQAVLHGLTFTIGLTLARGLVALALVHLAGAIVCLTRDRRWTRVEIDAARNHAPTPSSADERILSAVGLAVLAAIAFQWMAASVQSLDIIGTDADHYHIPHAVNIALGVSQFGLPATHHFYPMGTSVLSAWLILPVHDPLLVDLTTFLPFLLAWFAIVRIIGETTGRSGLAWAPWCGLLLFSMPLFRSGLDVSADLFYAAGFLATGAMLLTACVRPRLEAIDRVSLALSAGMLLGSKVTGAFSLAALVAVFGAITVGRRAFRQRGLVLSAASTARATMLFVALTVLAGGVWLIRNWYAFGSPFAPAGLSVGGLRIFPGDAYRDGMYYLSILEDFRTNPYYDTVGHAIARLVYWLRIWLGPWFLLSGLALAYPMMRLLGLGKRGRTGSDRTAMWVYLAATLVLCLAHFTLFAGVPWSSLEHYQGLSLRYSLPCFALIFVGGYLPFVLWTARLQPAVRAMAAVLAATLSIGWYVSHQTSNLVTGGAPGSMTAWSIAVAAACVAAVAGVMKTRPRLSWAVVAMLAIVGSASLAWLGARSDRDLLREAESAFDKASFWPQQVRDVYRGTYVAVLASERASGTACSTRRFFVTTRWDAPLELQPPTYANEVFDVRGATYSPRLLGRQHPGTQPCDYVIANVNELQTVRGVLLLNELRQKMDVPLAAEHAPFVVYRTVPRGSR